MQCVHHGLYITAVPLQAPVLPILETPMQILLLEVPVQLETPLPEAEVSPPALLAAEKRLARRAFRSEFLEMPHPQEPQAAPALARSVLPQPLAQEKVRDPVAAQERRNRHRHCHFRRRYCFLVRWKCRLEK